MAQPTHNDFFRQDRLGSVELRKVWLRYPEGALALQDVNLSIAPGEFLFLIGQTGSGKSSLLKLLNREIMATSGEVWVDGAEVGGLARRQVPFLRRRLGVVFQDFRLLPDRNVAENLAFAMHVVGLANREIRLRTRSVLELVGLVGKESSYPGQLSGGEQQRVAIARAIVNSPHLLFADEPTGSLDPETSWGIIRLLEKINDVGTTVLVASHDRAVVDRMRRRVVTLDAGRIRRDEQQAAYDLAAGGRPADALSAAPGSSS